VTVADVVLGYFDGISMEWALSYAMAGFVVLVEDTADCVPLFVVYLAFEYGAIRVEQLGYVIYRDWPCG